MSSNALATTTPAQGLSVIESEQRAGTVTRQDFGGQEIEVRAETAVTASAAAVRAEIEAAYVMALQRPRNMDLVYERIMRDCKRPGFATAAVYRLPRKAWNQETRSYENKVIKGLSIRFTEAAVRSMGNVVLKSQTIYDDDEKQIVQVIGIDLETNTRLEETVIVPKSIERKTVKDGTPVIGKRRNSFGDVVYLVQATDDEFRMKRNAEVARGRRNVGNQLVPGDIRDDAMAACDATMLDKASKDPDAERKALILAFSGLGVSPEQLAEYLGHSLTAAQPAELVDLRQVWRGIHDGQQTWAAVIEAKAAELKAKSGEAPKEEPKGSTAEKLKAKVEKANGEPAKAPGPSK